MDRNQILLDSAWCGDLERVKECLANGADIEARDDNGKTALMVAVVADSFELVKYLVEQGADINANLHIENFKATNSVATAMAFFFGYLDIAKYLVAQGAIVDRITLAMASRNGNLDGIKYLLNIADIDARIALVTATEIGDFEVVKYLVKNAYRLIDCDFALTYALKYGHLDIATYLLDNGADIDDKVFVLV